MATILEKWILVELTILKEYKWFIGEKINKDPGEKCVLDWVEKNAK